MRKSRKPKTAHQAWMEGPIRPFNAPRQPPFTSYFEEVRPLLLALRYVGRFPYSMTEDGVGPFSIFSIPAVYTFAFYIFSCVLSLNTLAVLAGTLKDSSTYYGSLQAFMAMAYLIQNLFVPFTFWLPAPKIVSYISLWSTHQCQFRKEFVKMRLRRLMGYFCIFLIPTCVVNALIITYYLINRADVVHSLPFQPLLFSSYLLIVFWWTSQFEVRRQAKSLSRIMISEGLNHRMLARRHRCWLSISSLTSRTGQALGLSCGGLSLSLFVSFLISLYGHLTMLVDNSESLQLELNMTFPAATAIVFFFILFDSANRTSREVGLQFSSMILNIKYSKLDKDSHREMSLFLQSIAAFPPVITLAGFLVANRSLYVRFVSNAVTYLVVLIQFRNK